MIAISRAMARQFRAVAKKCCNGRAREPDPEVVLKQSSGKLTFTARYSEVILQIDFTAQSKDEIEVVVPMSVLDRIQQVKSDLIELHCPKNRNGDARWVESSIPCSFPVQFQTPGKQHTLLERPKEFTSVPTNFLKCLHECGRSTEKQDGRFALSRIQIRGKQGQIIGTDGHIALICGGFRLPFAEDVLVPAVPIFGMSDWQSQEVSVGKTAAHLVVSTGPCTVWLSIISTGRFPDLNSLVPRQSSTVAKIDLQDSSTLLNVMDQLSGVNEDNQPVTVDLNEKVRIRSCDAESGETREITLVKSSVSGPSARYALDRQVLARALSLGCHTLRSPVAQESPNGPQKPLVAEGEGITFLAMPLDPELIIPPTKDAKAVSTDPNSLSTLPQRRNDVRPNEPNGRTHNGRSEQPPPPEAIDPLVLAEELRSALADATLKASKLVTALRSGRKEKKVLASVFAGLKQLNLNGTQP
jgi:DNA polymerase III sliding clamp (beta) subunit (PCNA family)